MQDILQTYKISDFKISQKFVAACTRFQRVAGPSIPVREDDGSDKYAINDRLQQHPKGRCKHQERYQE